jgi:hypothetical protein
VTDPAQAAAYAQAVDAEGVDVYVAPAFWPQAHRRRTKNTPAGLLALSLDLDVNGSPERDGTAKQGAAPSKGEAWALAQSIATPTFVVFTGGGIQPWWVFDEPWTFATDDEREEAAAFAQAWEQAHRDRVAWRIDPTADLSRVRRIRGTRNFKGAAPRPVKVKQPKGGRRWSVDDLRARVPVGLSTPRKAASASLNGHGGVPADRLASLMASRALRRVWEGRQRFPSDSDRDNALVKEAGRVGATEEEAAALIAQLRRKHGDAKGKADRPDYLDRTARSGMEAVRREGKPSVADVVARARQYLHVPTFDHWVFAQAVAVSASLDGDPLWGLIVGPPSSGKTEAIRALDDVADAHVDDLTASGLLGWVAKRGGKGHTTGLLSRVGTDAFATIADLSPLLDMSNKGKREDLYSLLRRAYDGRVVREFNGPPVPLVWEGRLTVLGAVTPIIDNFASHSDALGPRWLYFRLPSMTTQDAKAASRASRHVQGQAAHREAVRDLSSAVIPPAAIAAREVTPDEAMDDLLDNAARVATLGRTAVERESWGSRDILNVPQAEEPMRLARQLDLLTRGLTGLGLPREEVERMTLKAALDSMPVARRRVVAVLGTGEVVTTAEVARSTGMDRRVAKRALEDLAAIGLCEVKGQRRSGESDRWALVPGDDAHAVVAVISGRAG